MKTSKYLLPSYFKKIGWLLFPIFAALGIMFLVGVFDSEINKSSWLSSIVDSVDEISVIGLIISLLFIGFAKEKIEDEYVAKLRGDSLIWSLIVSYIILIVGTLAFYEFTYLYFVFINMFTILLLYVVKFNLAIHKFKTSGNNEE